MASVLAGAGNAAAGSLTCPGTISTADREHTLTLPGLAAPTGCITGSGSNDINGSPAQDIFVQTGWTYLDKDENPDTGFGVDESWLTVNSFGSSSAHFDIAAAAWAAYSEISVGFKVGQTAPTWAVFSLPFGTLSGDWSTLPVSNGGGLSHLTMYGRGTSDTPPPAVPEPASLLLLGSGLAITASKMRRRKKTV